MTKTYLEAYKPSIIKVSPETWNDKLLQHNIQLSKQLNIKHQNNLKRTNSSAFRDWPSRHLPASWGIRGLSKIAVDDFFIVDLLAHYYSPVQGLWWQWPSEWWWWWEGWELPARPSRGRGSRFSGQDFPCSKSVYYRKVTSWKRHFGSPKLKSQKLSKITRNIFWKKTFLKCSHFADSKNTFVRNFFLNLAQESRPMWGDIYAHF